jgi:NTP pyrophosphatase (non-canonical NTP hydrolase)
MPMSAAGLAKLIEECGELQQVAGKKLAYFWTDYHPDGAGPLTTRMEAEMGDVLAAIDLCITTLSLSAENVEARRSWKLELFQHWDTLEDNNTEGVDACPRCIAKTEG